MKPRFALDLTDDVIGLLERSGDMWRRIGTADLGSPDMDTELAALRRLAEDRAPDGFFTKLILPNAQILYFEAETPGLDSQARRAQIRATLEGRTPYAVDDLAFDWSRSGDRSRVAVLARLTLTEAESFADAHGFRPAAFVAVPPAGAFAGEPFFGLTDCAPRHLPPGDRYDRDQDPVQVTASDDPAPVARPEGAVPAQEAAGADPVAPGTGGPMVCTADLPVVPDAEPIADPAGARRADEAHADEQPADEAPFIAIEDDLDLSDTLQGTASPVAHVDLPAPAPAEPSVLIAALPADIGMAPLPAPGAFQSRRAPGPSGDEGDRLATVQPRLGGFASVPRTRLVPPAPMVPEEAAETLATAQIGEGLAGQAAAQPTAPTVGAADRPTFLSTRRADVPDVPAPVAVASVRQRLVDRSIFGGRRAPRAAGRAAVNFWLILPAVGLALSALLLWAFLFTRTTPPQTALTPPPTTSTPMAPTTAALPAPTGTEPATDQTAQTTAEVAAQTPAAPAPAVTAGKPAATPAVPDLPVPALSATPPAAVATVAPDASGGGTDLPSDQPAPASPAPDVPQTDLKIADSPLPAQPLPQPFGTLLRYDDRGQIIATPEGVVAPGGFTLFSGKPPALPKARPAGLAPKPAATPPATISPATAAPAAAPAAAAAPPADPRLAGFKPKPRPAAVAKAAEAAQKAAQAAAQAAAAAEAATASATDLAVASSRRPGPRPKGFAKIVAASRAATAPKLATGVDTSAVSAAVAEAQQTQPNAPATDTSAQAVEEPDVQPGVPDMPTTRTVAKKSTIANAINLNKINLIGIYGSSNSRRALVRLPSGRYLKLKVGDQLDGGQVVAISDSQLGYVKGGRTVVLDLLEKG